MTQKDVDEATLASAKDHIAQCRNCLVTISRLHQALAEPDWDLLAEVGRILPCEEIADDLAIYVEAKLAGQDVKRLFPLLWHHLQVCPRCQEEVHLLQEMILAEERREIPPLAKPVRRRTFLLKIARPWIRQRLGQIREKAPATRGEDLRHEDQPLLFRDIIADEREERAVTVNLFLKTKPDHGWGLQVRVVGEQPVADLPVVISCGVESRESLTDRDGVAKVEDIPPSWLDPDQEEDIQVRLG